MSYIRGLFTFSFSLTATNALKAQLFNKQGVIMSSQPMRIGALET